MRTCFTEPLLNFSERGKCHAANVISLFKACAVVDLTAALFKLLAN